jgi:hypothetical protein
MTSREITSHHDGQGLTEECGVYATDQPHPINGAHHSYALMRKDNGKAVGHIDFQRGPRHEADSTDGTLDGAVLAVLIDRYECFQRGPFSCLENDTVLGHLREAQQAIIARAKDRAARGVLGRNEK